MKRNFVSLVFALILLAGLVLSLVRNPAETGELLLKPDLPVGERVERFFRKRLPLRHRLQKYRVDLKLLSGSSEVDGLFYTGDRLIPMFEAASTDTADRNGEALRSFAEGAGRAPAFLLIPTASSVCRDLLPKNAILFDEEEWAASARASLQDTAHPVDPFPVLREARDEELYYRTEDLPTAHTAYKLYSLLGETLDYVPLPFSRFVVQPVLYDAYGSLYVRWGNGGLRGDTITVLRPMVFRKPLPEVVHVEPDGYGATCYAYYSPAAALGASPMDILLGGESPRINVRNRRASSRSLLLLGDRYAMPLIPLLSQHYSEIVFVEPSACTEKMVADWPSDFDECLVACSTREWIERDWSPALMLYASLRRSG